MTKKPTRKSMIKKLDKLVFEIVLKRDGGKCVVCGSKEKLSPGHVFSRRHLATRWNLQNVHVQCIPCNYLHVRDQYPYFNWFVRTYGQVALDDLRAKYQLITHYKIKDLEEMYADLEAK